MHLCKKNQKVSLSSIQLSFQLQTELKKTIVDHFSRKTEIWLMGLSNVLKKDVTCVSSDADSLALRKFLLMEEKCRDTNQRLILSPGKSDLDAIIHRAQRLIHRCLGYDLDVIELLDSGRFGPGSSYSCRGRSATPAHKFESNEISSQAHTFVSLLIQRHAPSWSLFLTDSDSASPLFGTRNHGRLSFVPKNNDISRTIIVEPELNTFFQLALGSMIRKRVKRSFRLDLNRADVDNRRLARLGSIDNTLATVDFSSASDTISLELVRLLLPPCWFQALCLFRTTAVKLPDGSIVGLEKISSMGNGYTWELESLIFHALAVATCDIEGFNSFWVNTFGDDVIIPSGASSKFFQVTEFLGLIVNKEKSFVDGPFRESCGEDYYSGLDVRPKYLGDCASGYSLLNFTNQLQRSHHETYRLLARKLIPFIPMPLRVWGCRLDGCLWRDSSAFKPHNMFEGVIHQHIAGVPERVDYPNNRWTLLYKVHTLTQDGQRFSSRNINHLVIKEVFTPLTYA